jgi:hypothetical protein
LPDDVEVYTHRERQDRSRRQYGHKYKHPAFT